jgi:hypothetical protein
LNRRSSRGNIGLSVKERAMTKLLLAFAAFAAFPLAAAADVTKEDIKKLVAAGISDDVIISYIRSNSPVRKLSADDVVELKQAGTSERVLSNLMASVSGSAPARPAETVVEQPSYVPSSTVVYESPYYYGSYYYPYSYWYPYYSWYGGFGCYPYYGYSNCYPYYSYGNCYPYVNHYTGYAGAYGTSGYAGKGYSGYAGKGYSGGGYTGGSAAAASRGGTGYSAAPAGHSVGRGAGMGSRGGGGGGGYRGGR